MSSLSSHAVSKQLEIAPEPLPECPKCLTRLCKLLQKLQELQSGEAVSSRRSDLVIPQGVLLPGGFEDEEEVNFDQCGDGRLVG